MQTGFERKTYRASLQMATHAHQQPYFCVVLDGEFSERSEAGKRRCGAGTVLFRPRGELHEDAFGSGGAECLIAWLGPSLLPTGIEASLLDAGVSRSFTNTRMNWLADQLSDELRPGDEASQIGARGFALAMVAELYRSSSETGGREAPEWLERVVGLIEDNLDQSWSTSEMAEIVGIHPTHLARTFKSHHNCTIGQFVRQARVRNACLQLNDTDASLSSIAFNAGFCDQSHFTRSFRALVGQTPQAYRKAIAR